MFRIIWYLPAVDVPRSKRIVFCLSDSADVESLSPDSSDEEENEEEEEQKAEVTSMDEALRTVTDTADVGQKDFLKQNFETLDESCSRGTRGQTQL